MERPSPVRRIRIRRDVVILTVALGLLVFEVLVGGARPAVLTVIGALLTLPGILRLDESRRPTREESGDTPAD